MPNHTKSRNHCSENKDGVKKQKRNQESCHSISKRSVKNEQNRDKEINGESGSFLPSFTPFMVFVVTLAFRVYYVTDPKNWWMVHPDEVYQSVEVAHIEVYGYGFRTYDFSPPESLSEEVTKYRQMQLKANMYALRSPLFPYYYVLVSRITSIFGLQVNPYLLWRVAHVFITSLLPLTLYRFVSRLFGVKDKGHIAAILVATSSHLNVFGTHCLLHSFLSPFTFLALSMLTSSSSRTYNPFTTSKNHKTSIYSQKNLNSKSKDDILNNNEPSLHLKTKTKSDFKAANKNAVLKSNNNNGITTENSSELKDTKENDNFMQNRSNSTACLKTITSRLETILGWFLATLICYIRPDVLTLFMIYVILFSEIRQSLTPRNFAYVILGVFAAVAAGTTADFRYYSWGMFSPINWINFNVILGFSAVIFGHMSWSFYVQKFFYHDFGIMTLSLFAFVSFYWLISQSKNCKEFEGNIEQTKKSSKHSLSLKSLFVWLALFLAFSLNGHKETRFIHDIIITFFIFIADILTNLKSIFQSRTKIYNTFISLVLVLFTASQWQSFPSPSKNSDWVYQKTDSTHDVNLCIKYISEQNDVTGVFYDANLYMTGGTSLLHHDVTIMSFLESGFYEFGPDSRRNYTSTVHNFLHLLTTSSSNAARSVNEFTRATNYIALTNAQAALRVIVQKPVYNYMVLKQDRKFVSYGFDEVFSTKSSRVLRRLLDEESEYMLHGLIDKISMGNNATVLVHEGDVLFNMNQFLEASTRFYHALTLDEKVLDAYLPLQLCYSKLGDSRAARAVRGKCLRLFDEASCSTPRKITRL